MKITLPHWAMIACTGLGIIVGGVSFLPQLHDYTVPLVALAGTLIGAGQTGALMLPSIKIGG